MIVLKLEKVIAALSLYIKYHLGYTKLVFQLDAFLSTTEVYKLEFCTTGKKIIYCIHLRYMKCSLIHSSSELYSTNKWGVTGRKPIKIWGEGVAMYFNRGRVVQPLLTKCPIHTAKKVCSYAPHTSQLILYPTPTKSKYQPVDPPLHQIEIPQNPPPSKIEIHATLSPQILIGFRPVTPPTFFLEKPLVKNATDLISYTF